MSAPVIAVGILSGAEIHFNLTGIYSTSGESIVTGPQTTRLTASGLGVEWNGHTASSLVFSPTSPEGDTFELEGVTIGVNFHWERRESQRFRGSLKIICHNGTLTAINLIDAEEYLVSVISSEMNSAASGSLLRAHAVISRSWLMACLDSRHPLSPPKARMEERDDVIMRWWDREDHDIYDVCADDHCQRYQGTGRTSDAAASAVADTRGMVLTTGEGRLCDTRFSKCCGGVFERFESCWDDTPHPYLAPRADRPDPDDFPDLTREEEARRWIESEPEAFCNTTSRRILGQVLNSYDREQPDFYRWEVSYSRAELSGLIARRLGRDLGEITSLIPLERGTSGRIVRLRIKGTLGEVTIGKELMIRRTLSESHLRSSAFTVNETSDGFTLRGAGWGHGVGLCQIGAAVMGERGYAWQEILARYYPGSKLTRMYQ